jgi:predicted DNA-binding protein (MmcQ/YjbR family)
MDIEWVRKLCLSFPQTTEEEVWDNDLTFKVVGKMFAHTVLVPAPVWLSFKASPESFVELTERACIVPAPYLARAKWVALETKDALSPDELSRLLRASYDMVVAKLPKRTQAAMSGSAQPPRTHAGKIKGAKKKKSAPGVPTRKSGRKKR